MLTESAVTIEPTTAKRTTPMSPRARQIARGLIRTDRASRGRGHPYDGALIRLDRCAGGFFWIGADGDRVLRGHAVTDAAPPQPSFVEKMARAGAA